MPELMDGAILCGLLAAGIAWSLKHQEGGRRVPVWGVAVIAVLGAYLGPPLFAAIKGPLSRFRASLG